MSTLPELRGRLEPFKIHILALAVAVALGIGVGFIKTSRAPAKVPEADRWVLPHWQQFQSGPVRQELLAAAIFSQDAAKKKADADAAAAAAIPVWRFTGTVREGNEQVALIEVDKGHKIKRLVPGDELPGGAKVKAVQVGTLIYTDSIGEQVLKLFSSDSAPQPTGKPRK